MNMRVVIFGATGATGKILVDLALAKGYEVVAVVRDPTKLKPRPHLEIVTADVLDREQVASALQGGDAVLAALGARHLGRSSLLEMSMMNILAGMKEHGIRRIVVLGAAGALHDPNRHASTGRKIFFAIIRNTFLRHPMNDSAKQEELVEASDTDYTVVHPPRLTNDQPAGHYRVEVQGLPAGGRTLDRADLAEFMVNQLTDTRFIRLGPHIAV